MKIAVSTESTSDLTKELIDKYDVKVIPYNIVHGDVMFKDGEMTTEELLNLSESSGVLPKTNALNEFEYTEYFENIKKTIQKNCFSLNPPGNLVTVLFLF